jgi:hypothetical protein
MRAVKKVEHAMRRDVVEGTLRPSKLTEQLVYLMRYIPEQTIDTLLKPSKKLKRFFSLLKAGSSVDKSRAATNRNSWQDRLGSAMEAPQLAVVFGNDRLKFRSCLRALASETFELGELVFELMNCSVNSSVTCVLGCIDGDIHQARKKPTQLVRSRSQSSCHFLRR